MLLFKIVSNFEKRKRREKKSFLYIETVCLFVFCNWSSGQGVISAEVGGDGKPWKGRNALVILVTVNVQLLLFDLWQN